MNIRLIVVGLACVGCGHDSSSSKEQDDRATAGVVKQPGAPARNPCEYMARADAETAIGLPLPKTTENVTLGMCDYMSPEFYGASMTLGDWDGVKTAATGGAGARPPTAVAGVGDEALTRGGGLLYVRKGDRGILLSLTGPQFDALPDHGLEREKTLARTILAKL